MKKVKRNQIWQILYPLGMYYAASSICYFVLELLLGNANETYMLRQLVCAAFTIPVTLQFYRNDQTMLVTVYGKQTFHLNRMHAKTIAVTILSAAALGIAVNNIIAMTPLMHVSDGFQKANDAFFAGTVFYEIFGSCLLIPIAEELLFRGVVYRRLKGMMEVYPAIVCSALIFGLVHMNLVQFCYASVLGCLLAFLYEKTGFFYVPVLGHIAANAIAVLRAETGIFSFSYTCSVPGILFTAGMLGIALGILLKASYATWESTREV